MTADEHAEDASFEQRLRAARAALDAPPGSRQPGGPAQARGSGGAVDDRIRAVAGTGGRIESLELDPRVMRMPVEQLAAGLAAALNAALDDLRAQASAGAVDVVPAATTLVARLREVRNQGLRQLELISRGINDTLADVRHRADVGGAADLGGLEQMLSRVEQGIALAGSGPADPPAAGAVGQAADDQVRVLVDGGGRIEAVELGPRALRAGSQGLAEHTVAAANSALDETRARAAEQAGAFDAGLSERLREVQDESVRQLGSYLSALTDLMNSIQKR